MFWILAFIIVTLILLYYKLTYFTYRGPLPGLSPNFFFGNLIQSGLLRGKTSLPEVLLAFKNRFGDVYQFWLGSTCFVVVSEPDDVKHIFTHPKIYEHGGLLVETVSILVENSLLVLDGAKFKRHHALTAPLLRQAKIVSNLDIIIDCTDRLLNKWRHYSPEYIHTEINEYCENLILDIFGFIGFDFDLKTLDKNSHEFPKALHDFLSSYKVITYLPKVMSQLYLRYSRQHQQAKKIIEKYLFQAINNELANSEDSLGERKKTCFITSLVSSIQKDEKVEAKKNEEDKQGLSRKEILDEMLAFMIASYESTSTVLIWFIHLMSKYPRVQDKIKAELMVENTRSELTLDRLNSLVYLDCVINEVFRYIPPIFGTARMMSINDRLPKSDVELTSGTQIFISFYNLTRDCRIWSIDPEQFYPERFLNEDKNHHSYGLIPFGAGHRQCVGQDLAKFELKVIAARLMQHVTFGDGGFQINSGGFSSNATVKPKHIGVTMKFN